MPAILCNRPRSRACAVALCARSHTYFGYYGALDCRWWCCQLVALGAKSHLFWTCCSRYLYWLGCHLGFGVFEGAWWCRRFRAGVPSCNWCLWSWFKSMLPSDSERPWGNGPVDVLHVTSSRVLWAARASRNRSFGLKLVDRSRSVLATHFGNPLEWRSCHCDGDRIPSFISSSLNLNNHCAQSLLKSFIH